MPQAPTSAEIRHLLGSYFNLVHGRKSKGKGMGKGKWTGVGIPLKNSTAAISELKQPTPPAGSKPGVILIGVYTGFREQVIYII
jgi:hypothetical protein